MKNLTQLPEGVKEIIVLPTSSKSPIHAMLFYVLENGDITAPDGSDPLIAVKFTIDSLAKLADSLEYEMEALKKSRLGLKRLIEMMEEEVKGEELTPSQESIMVDIRRRQEAVDAKVKDAGEKITISIQDATNQIEALETLFPNKSVVQQTQSLLTKIMRKQSS